MDFDRRGALFGFAGAAAVLVGIVWLVGVEELSRSLSMLDPRHLLLIAAVAVCWLAAWSFALRMVLGVLEAPVTHLQAFVLFAGATFANNVTPFGQAGGEPVAAYLISRETSTEYEQGLAAIASVDALNFLPSVALALLGLAYYVAVAAVGRRLLLVLGVVGLLAIGVPAAGYAAWRYRALLERFAVGALTPVLSTIGRLVPRLPTPTRDGLRDRVQAFFRSVERVATNRRGLAVAVAYSLSGWLLMCAMLWLSLYALGYVVPAAAVFVAVPVGTIASVTPLPGGLGGVEATLVVVVLPLTGIPPAAAASAALVYRGATYWLPTVVGGVAVGLLQARTDS